MLLIDKPAGWSSFDVVAKVRGVLRASQPSPTISPQHTAPKKLKVGHCGTLDPLATGLLIVVVGNYCKRAASFSKQDKIYHVTMTLGQTSTTGDAEGDKTAVSELRPIKKQLLHVFEQFTGVSMQTPPAYSAVKVNGQRAYKLARAGKTVVIEPRQVTIYHMQLIDYTYPIVTFSTKVSSGTYIRSLVQDVGAALQTGAYMSGLRRSHIGAYQVADALPVAAINPETLGQHVRTVAEPPA